MSEKEKSVILSGDIPVKTNRHRTVLSPVVSDLAALFLKPPLPIDTSTSAPGFIDGGKVNREIRATRKNVSSLLKKYE
jgi:hypothetical protein